MPQPVSYNPGTPVSGSIQENNISYVVDGQQRNYRGGFGGLSWMSEVPAENNVIFIGNSTSLGRGPANIPLFYPAYNTSQANIVYTANTLPGSPRNFTTSASAYNWAVTNNFFINNSDNPIPRIDADGLTFYVDANQPSSYPQTGTSWYDLSGRNTNGTLQNGVSWIAPSGSFFFDGTDDYVSLGNLGTVGDNQTIEVWFNSNSVTNYKNVLDMNYSTYNPNTGNVGPRLEQYSTSQIVWIWSGNTTNNNIYNFTALENISANRWYHTVFTLNSGAWQWHLNGTLIQSGTSPQGYITTYGDVNLGRGFILDPSRYFSGLESSARIYSRTLSTSDVKQNYFQSNIVTDGLVFMVDANNLVSYPRSGTNWYSLTSSFSASLVNGPAFNNSNGGSIVFDGTDDYGILNPSCIPTGNEISISFWNYGINAQNSSIIASSQNSSEQTLNIHLPWSNSYIYWDCGSPFNRINKEATPSEYQGWHHWVFTKNASTGNMSIYLDGLLWHSGTGLTSTIPAMDIARIGSYWNNSINHNGRIAQCLIYNRALNATEIQQNYQATKDKFQGPQIVTNGLVLNLDAANKDSYPGTGTTWYDLSGNGNHATKNGNNANPVWNSAGGYFAFAASDGSTGANNIFTVANSATLQNLTDITVQFICAMETKTPVGSDYDWMCIVTKGEEGGNQRPGTSVNQLPGNRYYHIETPNGVNSVGDLFTNADYTGNKWNLFQTRVSNAGGTQGWLNGTQVATSGVTTTGNTSPLYIGSNGFFELFKGKMGVVCIYNRALSDAELVQNYNYFKTRFGL